jgi:hypothetical protein
MTPPLRRYVWGGPAPGFRPGAVRTSTKRRWVSRSMIAGQLPVATIAPWWLRKPASRGWMSIRRSCWVPQGPPAGVMIPAACHSRAIVRRDSPLSKRRTASRMASASPGISWRQSAVRPNARRPPQFGWPALASSSNFERSRSEMLSDSILAMPTIMRTTNSPAGVLVSNCSWTLASIAPCSSQMPQQRWKSAWLRTSRSSFQTSTPSILPAARSASRRSNAGRRTCR